jgi:RNA polymerase sigma factor (sigma-70 family)
MAPRQETESAIDGGQDLFTSTHWSLVLQAGLEGSSAGAAALEQLCRTYWYPLYVYARRHGHGPEDAEDLIQGYFLQLIRNKTFSHVDPSKGRFRAFLLAGLKYYVSDWRDKAGAQRRGGKVRTVPIDLKAAELRYSSACSEQFSPDKLYERHWAIALLERVLERLQEQYSQAGKQRLFSALRPFLLESGRGEPYAALGAELGLSEEAVKKSVQRLRQRYGALVRNEISRLVGSPAEIEEELQYLRSIMTG